MYIRYFSGNMKNLNSNDLSKALNNIKKFDEIFIFEQLSVDIQNFLKKKILIIIIKLWIKKIIPNLIKNILI